MNVLAFSIAHDSSVAYLENGQLKFFCKEEVKKYIPGVVHVDGSCRVQTVATGFLFDLLTEFKKQTGVGVLLNTSFNLAGEPLVQTIEEALAVVRQSSLEAIFFPEQSTLFLGGSQAANS
jgi:predicted NodU family carbamoyl transferase